jgi:hypothetical protein
VTGLPAGVVAPRKVRIYFRRDHYVLQWWDPQEKATLSHRVEGDLVAAIAQAREIDERLSAVRSSGRPRHRRVDHGDLVVRFQSDLSRRSAAGEIDPATVRRYEAALRHYLGFCELSSIAKAFPNAATVNRDFRLAFAAFLAERTVSGDGIGEAGRRLMKGQAFVMDTVRALFEWAADPHRGNLLPDGFRNPFLRHGATRSSLQCDPLAEPDITLAMALDLVRACDRHQLLLFAPLLLFGLRASEPCYLFREYLEGDWLRVPCNPDLAYRTKGRRDKRFPLLAELKPLWDALLRDGDAGLLYLRRAVRDGREAAPLRGRPLADVVVAFRKRCAGIGTVDARGRKRVRDAVLHEAGGLRYDHIEQEFGTLARGLGWRTEATLKDLRHLFATTLGNTPMPEGYRRYLMGQAPGKAAIVAYTHLNELYRHYAEAVRREWQPLVAAILRRLSELSNNS